jgi:hypothetical protein
MKKPYQIESQQAVKRLERMAAEGNPDVQLVLPMAETLEGGLIMGQTKGEPPAEASFDQLNEQVYGPMQGNSTLNI